VQEQYWDEAESDMVDLPSGRLWDGETGNPDKVRAIDGQARGVDDLVTLGFRHGADGTGVWYVVPDNKGIFHAKVTASSSGSADHTIAELDANGDVLSGGRTPTDAQALNERKGVPVDTKLIVFDLGPTAADGDHVYKFIIPDGYSGTAKELLDVLHDADTDDWDVENQGGTLGVEYDVARVKMSDSRVTIANREMETDASGFLKTISAETVKDIRADPVDNVKDLHISMVLTAEAAPDPEFVTIKLNQPQAQDSTVTFSPGDGILINNGTADVVLSFDDSGRRCDAAGGAVAAGDTPVLIEHDPNFDFPGSGSGCTATYNVVTGSNGTSVTADDCSWELLFIEASHTGMIVGIEANAVADAVNDQAEVTLQANFADVNGYDGAKKQVLVNDNGTIKWVDTAECP
jgi:hypothetical protein